MQNKAYLKWLVFEDVLHNELLPSINEFLKDHLLGALWDMVSLLVVVRSGVHPVLEVVIGFHLVRLVNQQLEVPHSVGICLLRED